MKLMVIGGGGREHAIIKKLKENPAVEVIYCLPGNGGIAADAVCVSEIGAKDISAQVEFAKVHRIDYAVVAPDDPLRPRQEGRRHRGEQGLFQGSDEKVRHPHGEV